MLNAKGIIIEYIEEKARARVVNNVIPILESVQQILDNNLKPGERYVVGEEVWNKFLSGRYNEQLAIFFNEIKKPFRVLLVTSCGVIDESNQFVSIPSLGVWKLAQYLVSELDFIDAIVYDPNLGGLKTLKDLLSTQEFDLIGISIIPANIKNDLEVITLIKELQPESFLVTGGINSDSLFQWKYFADLPIDALIVGPGEKALADLIVAISINRDDVRRSQYDNLPIILRSATVCRKFTLDESFLPFGRGDLIHSVGYSTNVLYHKFSNACPESCFWCVAPKDGLQESDPLTAVKIIEAKLHSCQYSDISFIDNNLITHQKFIKKACEIMSMREIKNIPKHGKMTVSKTAIDLLNVFRSAGFIRLSFGIESFSPEVRTGLGKYFSDDLINTILSSVIKRKIRPEINLILFSPFETVSTISRTLQEAAEWVINYDCFIMVVLGLRAVIGMRTMPTQLKIKQTHVSLLDGKNIELPGFFEMNYEMEQIYQEVVEIYQRKIEIFREPAVHSISNHIKSLLKCQTVAEVLGLSCSSKFERGIKFQSHINYIHV